MHSSVANGIYSRLRRVRGAPLRDDHVAMLHVMRYCFWRFTLPPCSNSSLQRRGFHCQTPEANGVFAVLILRAEFRPVREDSARNLEMSFQRFEIQWSHRASPKVSPHLVQCIDVGTANEKLWNNLSNYVKIISKSN